MGAPDKGGTHMLVVAGDRVPGSSQIHLTGATTLWDHGPEPDWVPEPLQEAWSLCFLFTRLL